MTSTSFLFVRRASFPPLSMIPLPDLRHRPAIWTKASGLASKIIPMTPMGNVRFSSMNPGSSSRFSLTRPTGSAREESSLSPVVADLSFSSEKASLWRIESGIPDVLAASRSRLFSLNISAFLDDSASAILIRASFLSLSEEEARTMADFLTVAKESKRFPMVQAFFSSSSDFLDAA